MIDFSLMSGTGNTFVVIDNRDKIISDVFAFTIEKSKKFHVDGSLIVENSDSQDFKMRIINADGSEAEMCGNGARCIAQFAFDNKIVTSKFMSFETLAGPIKAEIKTNNLVKVQLTPPSDLKENLSLTGDLYTGQTFFINTGVPHTVLFVDDVDNIDVYGIGKEIRYSDTFKPAGTNVNFVQIIDKHNIKVRTYERGVENETKACGTGSTASALISTVIEKTQNPVEVLTRNKEKLKVYFTFDSTKKKFNNVFLEGQVSYLKKN